MPSYKHCFIALTVLSIIVDAALATDEDETPLVRMARSPKKKSTKKPGGGGSGKHHVPCSVTCTNGGHTPTCCDAHGLSGGKCVGEKAFCT